MPNFFAMRGSLPVWGMPSYGQFFGSPVKNCINSRMLFPAARGIYSRSVSACNPPAQFLQGISMPSLYGYYNCGLPNHLPILRPYLSNAAMGYHQRSIYDRMVRPFSFPNSYSGLPVNTLNHVVKQKDQAVEQAQLDQSNTVTVPPILPDMDESARKSVGRYKVDDRDNESKEPYRDLTPKDSVQNSQSKVELPGQNTSTERISDEQWIDWKQKQRAIDQQASYQENHRRQNVLTVNKWLPIAENAEPDHRLLKEPFKRLTGLKWKDLPKHEQRRMIDKVRQHLFRQPVDLEERKGFAMDRTVWYLSSKHQSGFQECSPETATVLKKRFGREGIILGSHLVEAVNQTVEKYIALPNSAGPLSPKQNLTVEQLAVSRVSKSMLNMEQLSTRTAALMTNSPLENGFEESGQLARSLLSEIQNAEDSVESSLSLAPEELQILYRAMISDLKFQKSKVNSFIYQLDINSDDSPLSHDKWQKVKANELKVAIAVIDKKIQSLLAKKVPNQKKISSISELRKDLIKELGYVSSGTDGYDRSVETRRSGRLRVDDYAASIRKLLLQKGVKSSEEKIRERQDKARVEVLKEGWKPITKQLAVEIGGNTGLYTSQITPVSSLSFHTGSSDKKSKPECILLYKEGEGVPSLCKSETGHAVNLNETGFYKGGRNEKGLDSTLYKGLRSGTVGPGPVFIPDEKERRAAAKQRAIELVVAALRLEFEKHPEKWLESLNGEVVPVKLVSTSLLSTDSIRNNAFIKKLVKQGIEMGLQDNELEMQKEQIEAFDEIKRDLEAGGTLDIRDAKGTVHSVKVCLETANFNFGVNPLALKHMGEKEANYGNKDDEKRFIGFKDHAWLEAPKYNIKGLKTLIGDFDKPGAWSIGGWAKEFIERSGVSDSEKKIIQQLAGQIRELYLTGDYKQEGEDAYKMVARIGLLAYKIEAVPHFNCKSGKDRTGEADATVKRLAAEVDALGYVPDPWEPVSRQDQLRSQMFAWNTGNMELLLQNVNAPGYKVATGMNRMGPVVWNKVRHRSNPQFEKGRQQLPLLKGLFVPAA